MIKTYMDIIFARTFEHPLALRGLVEWIPIDFVVDIANPAPSDTTCLEDWEKVHEQVNLDTLFEDMVIRGMRDPFIISVGRISRTIRLETGNHRIRILKDKGVKYVPCVALVSDYGIKNSGNGDHRFKADLLIEHGDPIFGPYDEHIYHKPSDVIRDVAVMQEERLGG